MRILSNLTDWNNGQKVTVYENEGKLYVNDNFGISSKEIDIDKWLSIYKIFFGEDKIYNLTKTDKRLFERGIYNN